MRISDWSSDVCSSDLVTFAITASWRSLATEPLVALIVVPLMSTPYKSSTLIMSSSPRPSTTSERSSAVIAVPFELLRLDERRVGKECVRTGRSRWSPQHKKTNNDTVYRRVHSVHDLTSLTIYSQHDHN